jgi:hypothetical protein
MARAQNKDRRQQASQAANKKRWRQEDINRNLELTAPVKSLEIHELEAFDNGNVKGDDKRCTRGYPRRMPEKSQFAYWYHKPKYVVRRIPRENAFKPTQEIRR